MSHTRQLTRADASRLQLLRREALSEEPTAFGSSPADCRFREPSAVDACLVDDDRAVYAIADPDDPERIVAMAGISRESREKQRHRASIWGVYVSRGHRGRGFGRAVVAACVDHARTWPAVDCVTLGVSADGSAARSLYESLGFAIWGTEPDALRINGRAIPQHHMMLRLSTSTSTPSPIGHSVSTDR
jgi:RimJ/RimL family protein N-acetyltransferase